MTSQILQISGRVVHLIRGDRPRPAFIEGYRWVQCISGVFLDGSPGQVDEYREILTEDMLELHENVVITIEPEKTCTSIQRHK